MEDVDVFGLGRTTVQNGLALRWTVTKAETTVDSESKKRANPDIEIRQKCRAEHLVAPSVANFVCKTLILTLNVDFSYFVSSSLRLAGS